MTASARGSGWSRLGAPRFLEPEPGSSFSDLWYRVAPTRPRLSPHAQVTRQRFGPGTHYVLEDPAATQYYRVGESAYFFLALLDGSRTVDEAWTACAEQMGDGAPTQRECVDLLGRLQLFGLLVGEGALAPDMVSLRQREAIRQAVRARTGMGVSLTIPLHNPEPWLEATAHVWRAVWSRWGLLVWLLVAGWAGYLIATNLHGAAGLFGSLNGVLDPSNLPWLAGAFLVLRAWHELGHATACKAMGARCTELGLIVILLLLPFPYCDASAAWRLPATWRRVLVSGGGMLAESLLAGVAAIVWAHTEPGLLRTLCFNTMAISGFTTFVFNLNPLLRYDGYYILSDVLGVANLWQRSREVWRFLVERFAFGVKGVRPPAVRDGGEFWTLLVYGAFSTPYRVVVTLTIIYVIWINPRYLTLGIVLAGVALVMLLAWPVVRYIGYILGEPRLMGHRPRAALVSLATAAVVVGALGFVPAPAGVTAPGLVRPLVEGSVRPDEPGFVEELVRRPGERVEAGDVLVRLGSPEALAELAVARARVAQALAELDAASAEGPSRRAVAERGVDQARGALERARARVDALQVRAPVAGILVGGGGDLDFENLVGRFVGKGVLLGFVAGDERVIVRTQVSDRDQAYVFASGSSVEAAAQRGIRAAVRVPGRAWHEWDARIVRFPGAGSRELTTPSLAAPAGGDIVLDPTAGDGKRTLLAHFVVDVEPSLAGERLVPGQRARVKFSLPPEPLARQWWRRISQVISERAPS